MESLDAKAIAALAVLTMALVGGLKRAWPSWVGGKEEFLSVVVPIVLVFVFKIFGFWKGTNWENALVYSLMSGVGAGLVHDKILNPILKWRGSDPK